MRVLVEFQPQELDHISYYSGEGHAMEWVVSAGQCLTGNISCNLFDPNRRIINLEEEQFCNLGQVSGAVNGVSCQSDYQWIAPGRWNYTWRAIIKFLVDVDPAPTIFISSDPTAITVGSTTFLHWGSNNAGFLAIDQGIGSVTVPSGSREIPGLQQTTTFTLTGAGRGGVVSAQTTVTVNSSLPDFIVNLDDVNVDLTDNTGAVINQPGPQIEIGDEFSQGKAVVHGIRVKNIGADTSLAVYVRCQLMNTEQPSASIEFGHLMAGPWTSGTTKTMPDKSLSFSGEVFPLVNELTTLSGLNTLPLSCLADPLNQIQESNETNNLAQLQPFFIWPAIEAEVLVGDSNDPFDGAIVSFSLLSGGSDEKSSVTDKHGKARALPTKSTRSGPKPYRIKATADVIQLPPIIVLDRADINVDRPIVYKRQLHGRFSVAIKPILHIGLPTTLNEMLQNPLDNTYHVRFPDRVWAASRGFVVLSPSHDPHNCLLKRIRNGVALFTGLPADHYTIISSPKTAAAYCRIGDPIHDNQFTNSLEPPTLQTTNGTYVSFTDDHAPPAQVIFIGGSTATTQYPYQLYLKRVCETHENSSYRHLICSWEQDDPLYASRAKELRDLAWQEMSRMIAWSDFPLNQNFPVFIGPFVDDRNSSQYVPSDQVMGSASLRRSITQVFYGVVNYNTRHNKPGQLIVDHELFHVLDLIHGPWYAGNRDMSGVSDYKKYITRQLTDDGRFPDGHGLGGQVWNITSCATQHRDILCGYDSVSLIALPEYQRALEAFATEFSRLCTDKTYFTQDLQPIAFQLLWESIYHTSGEPPLAFINAYFWPRTRDASNDLQKFRAWYNDCLNH